MALAAWIIGLHPGVEWNWNNGLGWDKVGCFVVGPDPAGQGYVDPFMVAVALAALLRLVVAGWTWRRETSWVAAS